MKKTDFDFYTSKNFLTTEKGQNSLAILEKNIAIDDKIKRIGSLLKVDINCKDFDIDHLIKKINNEYNVTELIKSQLETGYKIGNSAVTEKYNAVSKIADDYQLIYCFLDDAKKKLPSTLLDHNKIAKFQAIYNDMIKQANDIKKFLDRYERLDVVNNMKEIGELTYDFLTKSSEHEKLTTIQIPRLAKALKTIDEKYKKNQANAYVKDLLNYLSIGYNSSISVDFYKSGGYEKGNAGNLEQECEFKHKENIIEEMFSYLHKNQIPFDEKDIILDNSSPTLYIYIKGINKTIVISNLYGVGTHIYPGKVDINEIAESSIQDVMTKHGGKRINFVGESGMDAWKKRFVETISTHTNINAQTQANPELNFQTEESPSYTPGIIRQKINEFLLGKENITSDTINFTQEYEGLISSIKGDTIYIWIGGSTEQHTFGRLKCFNSKVLDELKQWDTIRTKVSRIYPDGKITFKAIY